MSMARRKREKKFVLLTSAARGKVRPQDELMMRSFVSRIGPNRWKTAYSLGYAGSLIQQTGRTYWIRHLLSKREEKEGVQQPEQKKLAGVLFKGVEL